MKDRSVINSGRRLIQNIPGVRGVKFGYTIAAVQWRGIRGAWKEVVAVIFGGRTASWWEDAAHSRRRFCDL